MIILPPTSELIKFLHENGKYVILAHPILVRQRLEHFNENFHGIDGMEIYNNGTWPTAHGLLRHF